MIALTWVGMNKEYVKTNSSVRTDNFVVSTVSHGLMTQPKLNPVRQYPPSEKSGYITGKFTSQEPI